MEPALELRYPWVTHLKGAQVKNCKVRGGLSEPGQRGGLRSARTPPLPEVKEIHRPARIWIPNQTHAGLGVVTEGALGQDEVPDRVHRHRDASLHGFKFQSNFPKTRYRLSTCPAIARSWGLLSPQWRQSTE